MVVRQRRVNCTGPINSNFWQIKIVILISHLNIFIFTIYFSSTMIFFFSVAVRDRQQKSFEFLRRLCLLRGEVFKTNLLKIADFQTNVCYLYCIITKPQYESIRLPVSMLTFTLMELLCWRAYVLLYSTTAKNAKFTLLKTSLKY